MEMNSNDKGAYMEKSVTVLQKVYITQQSVRNTYNISSPLAGEFPHSSVQVQRPPVG